jgi:hypothetical protein
MMRKTITSLSVLALGCSTLFGQVNQAYEVTQIRSFGGSGLELAADMTVDSQGNQYLMGRFRGDFHDSTNVAYTGAGYDEIFVQKADINGSILWTKLVTTSSGHGISPKGVEVDSDDNVYVFFSAPRNATAIDHFGDSIVFNVSAPSLNGRDLFLWKIDASGTTAWTKTFGGNESDNAESMVIDHNDNIIISGYFEGETNLLPDQGPDPQSVTNNSFVLNSGCTACYDGFVAKLDSDGQTLWAEKIGGSNGTDIVRSVAVDMNINIIVAGSAQSQNFTFPDFSPLSGGSLGVGFIGKLSPNGDGLALNFADGNADDEINTVTTDANGSVYASILTKSSQLLLNANPQAIHNNLGTGTNDALVVKYDANLNYTWHHSVSSDGNDRVNSVFVHYNEQEILFTGGVSGTTTQNGIAYTHLGGNDMYIGKLTSSGTLDEFSYMGGPGHDLGNKIHVHHDGTLILYGEAENDVKFDVAGSIDTLTNAGSRDLFVVHGFDCDNFPTPTISMSSSGDSLVCDITGPGYTYYWTLDEGNGPGGLAWSTSTIAVLADGDYFVNLMDSHCTSLVSNTLTVVGAGIKETSASSFKLYPNPATSVIAIQTNTQSEIKEIIIINTYGQVCKHIRPGKNQTSMELPLDLTSGIYLVQITTDEGLYTEQLIVR